MFLVKFKVIIFKLCTLCLTIIINNTNNHYRLRLASVVRSGHDVKLHPHRVMSWAWRKTASTFSLSLVAFCTVVSWGRPVSVSLYTVVFIYESWFYLIWLRFLALIAFLCWCAVKQSINQPCLHGLVGFCIWETLPRNSMQTPSLRQPSFNHGGL